MERTLTTFNNRGWREVGGVAVALVYTIEVDDDGLPFIYEIDVDNSVSPPRVAAVVCIARHGASVSGEQLRSLKIASIVKEAAQNADLVGTPLQNPEGQIIGAAYPVSSDQHERYLDARRREERAGQRRVNDEDLRRVADVYRSALARKRPPTAAVQNELRLGTHAQAGRWVRKAREAGYLGPAPGWRQAGELTLPDEVGADRTRTAPPLPNRSTSPRSGSEHLNHGNGPGSTDQEY